ncbi:tetratricopeptide repeat-containing sensor histidine kinase [Balneolaceae bacterium ANBcel3]|nr:tetratricopeptide repeat-containing sensor histidine kinase [Balneolaceae bacterium ANBcel3]
MAVNLNIHTKHLLYKGCSAFICALLFLFFSLNACSKKEYDPGEKSLAELNDEVFILISQLQFEKADSLVNYVIEVARSQSNYNDLINAKTQLAILYQRQGMDDAFFECMDEVVSLAEKHGTARQKANAYIVLTNKYLEMDETTEAVLTIEKAIQIVPEIDDDMRAVAAVYGTKAQVIQAHDPAEALRLEYKALEIFQQMNDLHNQAIMLFRLGSLYQDLGDYEGSRPMLYRAIEMNKQLGRDYFITSLYYLLAVSYQSDEDSDQAMYYLNEAIETAIAYDQFGSMASLYTKKAKYLRLEGVFDEALSWLQKSKTLIEEIDSADIRASNAKEFVKLYYETENFSEMRVYLDELHMLDEELDDLSNRIVTWEMEARYREAFQDYQGAIDAYRSYMTYQDSLDQINRDKEIEEVRIAHEVDMKIAENELLQQELMYQIQLSNNQKRILIILTIAVLVIIVFLLVIFKNKKHLEKANVSLEKKNQVIYSKNQELEKLNTELKQLNQDKSRLIDIIVHDLRNPLFGIISFLDVMDETVTDETQREYLEIAKKSAERLNNLIDSLLDVHSLEKSEEVTEYNVLDVSDIVKQCIDTFKSIAEKKHIKIHFEATPIRVESNATYLSRIIDNLVSNAIKFSPEHKNVYIETVRKSEGQWKLVVKDEGQGFSYNDKKRVFQMFGRLSARPTGDEDSTGLGLYAVKILLEKLKGYIVLESNKGKGARFTCVLPVAYESDVSGYKNERETIHIS